MSLVELSKLPVQPLVIATVNKAAVDSEIGITLNYFDGGKIIVRNITEDGLFSDTDLKAGMVLTTVNDKEIKGMSTVEAMAIFLEAEESIEVVAEDIGLRIASFSKDSIGTKVGVSLRKYGKDSIIISGISEDSLLADSPLRVGNTLLGVNGTSCKNLPVTQAIALFKELQDLTVHTQETKLISVKAFKDSVDTKVGIGIKVIKGKIIISAVSDEGLFADSDIVPGLRLLAVNKTWCDGVSKDAAIKPFKDAVGPVTVLAQNVGYICGTGVKSSPDSKVGIALNNYGDDLIISSISEDGLFDDTDLFIGLKLVCVNSTMVKGLSKKESIGLFKAAHGKVTVIAERIGLIAATAIKESKEDTVGIALKDYQGMIIVSSINKDSIFAGSELQVGHKLVSVNKKEVSGMSKADAIGLFKQAEGEITVMAQEVGLFGSVVHKKTKDTKVGIGLKEMNGQVVVSSLYATGLFADTDIKEGQRLVSVNKTSMKGLSRKEAIQVFKDAVGDISVVAADM